MKPDGYLTPGRVRLALGLGLAACVLTAGVCLLFGQENIPARRVLGILAGGGGEQWEVTIVRRVRLPRVLLAMVVGGGLALAGAAFQALLRNPLATPHTLGVSAGGALGAAAAIYLGVSAPAIGPVRAVQLFALLGALVNVAIIYGLARRREFLSPLRLLLAGVTLGLICSALIMFVQFASDPDKLVQVNRWLMGGLDVEGFGDLASVLPFALPAVAMLLMEAGALNQLALGEELAAGRGVDVTATQVRTFLSGSVLTAALVSVAGPIGFVGLIVPHVLRLVFGPDHRLLLVLCLFGGATFLAAADTVARAGLRSTELPVGVLTALLGGPFFLVLLIRKVR